MTLLMRDNEMRAEGRAEAIIELLMDQGLVPDEISNIIRTERDMDTLGKWLKLAAKAESVEDFIQKSGIMEGALTGSSQ
ncbi:MAG: hypothetical protein IKQ56_08500 [Lachnospiraceae bacterium]|nr:hypothetical protein [Lachnospiraceae bacterium]